MLVAGPGCRAPGGWAGCACAAWGSVGGGLAARGVGLWGGCPRDGLSWVGVWLARLCPRGRGRGRAALLRPEPGLGSTRGRRAGRALEFVGPPAFVRPKQTHRPRWPWALGPPCGLQTADCWTRRGRSLLLFLKDFFERQIYRELGEEWRASSCIRWFTTAGAALIGSQEPGASSGFPVAWFPQAVGRGWVGNSGTAAGVHMGCCRRWRL